MEPSLPPLRLDATALQTLVIHLGAAGKGNLPTSCGRALHAQVLAWFHAGHPEIAQALHDSQTSPLSLSGLVDKQRNRTIKEGDAFSFRIGLLQGNLLEPLLKGLAKQGSSSLLLAQFPFVIKNINMLPGTDPQVDSSDYALLAQLPVDAGTLTLKFTSPTSFKLKQEQLIQPLPLPESVFGSLLRRWNTFAPEELRFPNIQWKGLLCDFELRSQRLKLNNVSELGSVGWVKYQFPDLHQARIANVLAHFAFFSGVGRKTTMGMGQTVLEGKR